MINDASPGAQWAKEKQMYGKMRISRHRLWCWWLAHCRPVASAWWSEWM